MHSIDPGTLLTIALGAFTIPIVAGRVGIPAAVGEILFGIAVGPRLLGILAPNPFAAFLAEFGFVFLMFLVGLELDFSRIERARARDFAVSGGVAALVFLVSLALTLLCGLAPYLFLAFGAMSVGILLVTLAEGGITKSDYGQTLIFVGSIGEFLTIILMTAYGIAYKFGFGWHLAEEMAKLGVIFVVAYVVLIVLRTLIWWYPASFSRLVATHDPSEIGVRAGMATMLVFVALASLMGVESILGAFIAGALFSFVFREKGILETKLSSIGFGFFVPIFFIWVGAEFDLDAVLHLEVARLVVLFLALTVAAKLLAVLPLLLLGFTRREALAAGFLFAAPLTLHVVIARVGVELRLIDAVVAGALVLLALVTSVLMPWLFRVVRGAS